MKHHHFQLIALIYGPISFVVHFVWFALLAIPAAWQAMKTDLNDTEPVYPPERNY